MGRIVVGIDGSETARLAFEEAVRQAQWRESDVHAVHVIQYPASLEYGAGYIDLENLKKAGTTFCEAEVEKLAQGYGGEFPVPVTSEVVIGHSGVEISRIAANDGGEPADLVVVGSRGLGPVRSVVLGSVTTYLVHHLDVPVLVVPEEGSEDAR